MRSLLYFIAKLMGDYNAVKKGTIHNRLHNSPLGKMLGRLFKWYLPITFTQMRFFRYLVGITLIMVL